LTSQPAPTSEAPHDHLVHEAVGPSLSPVQAGATIVVGVTGLLFAGVLPALLGAMADEHRLTAAGIGLTAMTESLAMGVSTALMGLIRRPRRLRLIAALACVTLAAINLAVTLASGVAFIALRGAAGAVEGVMLWITVAMIARTVTPERWAGVYFTTQTLGQLVLALSMALAIVPRFGANGGFLALAAACLAGLAGAALGPSKFAPLPHGAGESELPPARGWIALAGTLIYVSAAAAVGVYLQPLAHQAGLGAGVARTAIWISLAAQVCGSALAIVLAGRVRYFTVFLMTSSVYLVVWWVFAHSPAAWLFILANAGAGLFGLFLGPFLVPMMIDADPSRRAAMQSGAAQLLGAAFGPFLASRVVAGHDVHAVVWLGAGLLTAGLTVIAGLRFTPTRRPRLERVP
jgi:hypothetical protein